MTEDNVEKKYEILQRSFYTMPEQVFVKNSSLQYIAASEPFIREMGCSDIQALLGKTDHELLNDRNMVEQYEKTDREILKTGKNLVDCREEYYSPEQTIAYRSTSKYLIRDSQGRAVGIFGKVQDVTKEVTAEYRYHQEVETLFQMTDSDCYAAVIDLSAWKMVRDQTNPLYGKYLTPMSDLDAFLRKSLDYARDQAEEAYAFYSNFSLEYFKEQYQNGKDYFSLKYFHKLCNDENLWMKDTIQIRLNPQNSHLMALFSMQSIEEIKQKELELHRAAELDGLTGLLNRHYAKQLMESIIANPEDTKAYSMFMVDIDNFKQVNDTYGHQVGDRVLIGVADALKECFRSEDLVCRLGGDEFVAFMPRSKETFTAPDRAQLIMDRVSHKCLEGAHIKVTVSIGVCDYPKDGTTLQTLYGSADKALYEAKKLGKNQFYIYKA